MRIVSGQASVQRREERLLRERLAALDGKVTALVALGVGMEKSILAFTDADVAEVGKALVEGKVRLPSYARITVTTEVEERKDKVFGTSTILHHTADQLCCPGIQAMSIPAALECKLLVKVGTDWMFRPDVYRSLVPPDPRLT
jgi:hypothetical protein